MSGPVTEIVSCRSRNASSVFGSWTSVFSPLNSFVVFWFSFTDARLANTGSYGFVGVENYAAVLTDSGWWIAVRNTVFFAVVSVAIETVLGMIVALVLDENLPGRGLVRTAVLIPWAIPTIVSAQMWNWMYNDIYGVLNRMLVALGLITHPIAWTADPNLAIW